MKNLIYPIPTYQDFWGEISDRNRAELIDGSPIRDGLGSDEYFMRGNSGILPGSYLEYNIHDNFDIHSANNIWNEFDIANGTLVRGMHSLLKSEMLNKHYQFMDAALTSVHIAMDGAFSVTQEQLRKSGNISPSSFDAQQFLDTKFGVPMSKLKFFQDWYEDLIKNIHPNSRFGSDPIPQFCVDDIWDLAENLMDVYYILITGEVHPKIRTIIDRQKFHG